MKMTRLCSIQREREREGERERGDIMNADTGTLSREDRVQLEKNVEEKSNFPPILMEEDFFRSLPKTPGKCAVHLITRSKLVTGKFCAFGLSLYSPPPAAWSML